MSLSTRLQRALSHFPSTLFAWTLRTAVAAAVFSWGLPHIPIPPEYSNSNTSFFGVSALIVCSVQTLGASIDTGLWVSTGSVLGGLLAALVIACSGGFYLPSSTAMWVSVAFLSPIILLIPIPSVFTKMCLAVFLSTLLRTSQDEVINQSVPVNYMLGGLLGVVSALVPALLFAPRANTAVKSSRIAATRALAGAATAAAAAIDAPPAKRAALIHSVSTLLAQGEEARALFTSASVNARWEHVRCSRRHPPRPLGDLLLASQSMHLALLAAAEGDERLANLCAAAKTAVARERGGVVGDALQMELAVTQTAQMFATDFDACLAPVAIPLAAAVSDLLIACFDPPARWYDALCGHAPVSSAAAAAVQDASSRVVAALAALDIAFLKARSALTYSSSSNGHQHVPVKIAIAMHGVPPGRYFFVWALRACAAAALQQCAPVLGKEADMTGASTAAAAAVQAVETATATVAESDAAGKADASDAAVNSKDVEVGGGAGAGASGSPVAPVRTTCAKLISLLPTPRRLLYAGRLTASILVTIKVAQALLGSSVWAATAVAYIAPREGMTNGGSLHSAFLRVAGTTVGSLFGVIVAVNFHGSLDKSLVLGAWVFVVGFTRSSPRHAYAAVVSMFTPFLFLGISETNAAVSANQRIAETLLGIFIFTLFEIFLFPLRVAAAQRAELGASLSSAGVAVRAVMDGESGAVTQAAAALSAANSRQSLLLREAGDEPSWLPVVAQLPLPEAACRNALSECERAAVLLNVVAKLESTVHVDDRLLAPVAPALRYLLHSLGQRYDKLAEMARGDEGDWRSSVVLTGAQFGVVASLNNVFLDLQNKDLVSVSNAIGMNRILWAASALVENARDLGLAVRALGGQGLEEFVLEGL